ncbi:amidohydrolase [Rheinheimera sp. SA_1]|uniref:amidohydrolase n=1 Tax=Rheinheimera sp. SA_1 TaxID=1827365 RepID=UPI000A48CF71|nr:amidohydrolase [Rheinheimera sp. SA_1]
MSIKSVTAELKIAIIQSELVWQDAKANCDNFASCFAQLRDVDLVILPEMFNSGFSMQSAQIAEPMTGPTVLWLQQQAQFYQVAIAGSLAISTELGVVNRLMFVHPDGSLEYYDKKHLFRMAGEHQHYAAGSARSVVLYKGFRLNLQICYDLRFPVFARNQGDYDVLIYVANWPEPRRRIWSTLLAARAMENQAFVLGCNRVGQDGNQFSYSGDSVALNYLGEPMAEFPAGQAGILIATLRLDDLLKFRQQFPAALDADAFVLLDKES